MYIAASTQINQSIGNLGWIKSVNLVSEFGSGKVYAAISGYKSDETHIVDVSSEFKFPFQWKDEQRSQRLYRYYI